ncbi:uncharacterized protein METZ01_LOCUS190831 [marine metagenome]|uniref:Uncharacterized protein n=1 Tax=marine metagenome TaxID=408172 RepID=A0A382DK38_9ZZZZ
MSLKLYDSVGFCKQCVVVTTPDVPAWMKMRTTLANDHTTSADPFPAVPFDTKSVRITVSTVPTS